MAEDTILKQLLRHQVELINALEQLNPKFAQSSDETHKLNTLPKFGSFQIESGFWGYHVHGLGIRFVNIGTLEIVDMDDNISNPQYTSDYRLSTYKESIGD